MASRTCKYANQALVVLVAAAVVATSCTQAPAPKVLATVSNTPTKAVIATTTPSATPIPEPTSTSTPEPSPTATQIAAASLTQSWLWRLNTPGPSPTPEVKQYPICSIEKFRDCPIPYEDLFNGNYLRRLQTLSKPFDNPQDLKQLTSKLQIGEKWWFGAFNDPKNSFKDPTTAPLRRGVTTGYTTAGGVDVGTDKAVDYAVLPIEFYNPNSSTGSSWVITVLPGVTSYDKAGMLFPYIKGWPKDGSLIIYRSPLYAALVYRSFQMYPDLPQRVDNFAKNGDPTSLSLPGIILVTAYSR